MNMRALKIIALITMTIDHIGFYLFPLGPIHEILRSVGRIAFPLFAFMIAEGFRNTHDLRKYWLRLFIAALAMEAAMAVYFLATGDNWMLTTDIFLTLLFGLTGLILATRKGWGWKLLIVPLLAGAYFLELSYGVFGVLTVLIFGLIPIKGWQLGAYVLLMLAINEFPFYNLVGIDSPFEDRILGYWIQWFSLLAFVPLFLYNGQRGRFHKWFFYFYYPAHLIVILGIKYLVDLL